MTKPAGLILIFCFVPLLIACRAPEIAPLATAPVTTGELIIDGVGTCKFSALTTDTIITAAHCVLDDNTTQPFPLEKFHVSVTTPGQTPQSINILNIALTNGFSHKTQPDRSTVATDKAILQLDRPIKGTFEKIVPVPSNLSKVDILKDQTSQGLIFASCPVVRDGPSILIIDCPNYKGSSGKPVFVHLQNTRRLIGIISAGGISKKGKAVTFATVASTGISSMRWMFRTKSNHLKK